MKIKAFIKPNAKLESVTIDQDNLYTIKVNAAPVEGQANLRAAKLLAQHFKVSKSKVVLEKGHKSRYKIFKIQI